MGIRDPNHLVSGKGIRCLRGNGIEVVTGVLKRDCEKINKMDRKVRKERIGIVSSNKMEKSIVVVVERKVKHPLYEKFVKKSNKLVAHDGENTCNEGDKVKIMETRPLSKNKKWRLVEILERAK